MKKIAGFMLLALIVIFSMLFLVSCEDSGEHTYTVTENQWTESLSKRLPADNVTITTRISGGDGTTIEDITKLDLQNGIMMRTTIYNAEPDTEWILSVENGVVYEYSRDLTIKNAGWTKNKSQNFSLPINWEETANDSFCYNYVGVGANNYSDFKFDSDIQEYIADRFVCSFLGEEDYISDAAYSFIDGKFVSMQFARCDENWKISEMFFTKCTDYGTTVITLPVEFDAQ